MGTYSTINPKVDRPASDQFLPSSPLPPPVVDQPIFLILDSAMRRPVGDHPRGSRSLRRRRLGWWMRENRLGLWAGLVIGFAALAYALVLFTDASHRYGPTYYEPKDLDRWEWVRHSRR